MEKLMYSCLFLFTGILALAQLDVGDRCSSGNSGICVMVDACTVAVDQIKQQKTHNLERCGWKGKTEIVCCPEDSGFKNPKRTSEEACTKYSKGLSFDVTEFIIHGVNATIKEFPHMAALGYEKVLGEPKDVVWGDCGGSLISENFVLTAAHCLVRADNKEPVMVRLGKVDLFGDDDNVDGQDIRVTNSYAHPEYKPFQRINDIGLVKLEKKVEMNEYVKPVCIYTKKDDPVGLTVTGWGITEKENISRFLLKAPVEPVPLENCTKSYQNRQIVESQMCAWAGKDFPKDTCQGDSGGPIQVQNRVIVDATPYIVVGVTSFGRGCGGSTPSVYTRVSSYLDWIESKVWS